MSTSNKSSRINNQAADQKLIDGFTKHAANLTSMVIGNTTIKATDVVAVLQGRLATASTVLATRATWQSAVKADRDERAKTKPYVDGVKQALQVVFSGSIDGLGDFGLTARKPRVITPEQKAIAAAKAKATREARGTKGSVQKKAVKGNVTATLVVTPVDAPKPVTAPAPTPATTAPQAPAPANAPAPTPATGTTPHAS
ncbi:MAG: hypothetical protein ACRENE_09410 [Polyangiaceae bacterium]